MPRNRFGNFNRLIGLFPYPASSLGIGGILPCTYTLYVVCYVVYGIMLLLSVEQLGRCEVQSEQTQPEVF